MTYMDVHVQCQVNTNNLHEYDTPNYHASLGMWYVNKYICRDITWHSMSGTIHECIYICLPIQCLVFFLQYLNSQQILV